MTSFVSLCGLRFLIIKTPFVVKNPTARAGDESDMGSVPGSRRSPGVGNVNPLQYCLENSIDRGDWWATYSPRGHKELDMTEQLNSSSTVVVIQERNKIF